MKPTVSIICPKLSLVDLLGETYLSSVCDARAFLENKSKREYCQIANEKVEFFPIAFQDRINSLLPFVGKQVINPLIKTNPGAGTNSFVKASNLACAPLSGLGFIRIGENGRAYLTAKSEHYHASLGHSFPGYRLLDNARQLGIPNATHNNTRGYITRCLEQELVRLVNGLGEDDEKSLQKVLGSEDRHVLNRVINLETGSLAVEAAVKMMLSRFYRQEDTGAPPKYLGRIPVFIVIADRAGGKKANYHGTTMFTQLMRDLWPELSKRLETENIVVVKQVGANDLSQLEQLITEYDRPPYKVAGFIHEIILMNYGGIRLDMDFLQKAYALCDAQDIPTLVDEIQSCMWSPGLFMFREYGLHPDFVSIGKGFPGGEFPASRIITTPEMDNMRQFGALVTNGQEELASLAYLVTIEFAQANRAFVESVGDYYNAQLQKLGRQYPGLISRVEGARHLSTLFFHDADKLLEFITHLTQMGIDISAQTYKADCPPAALTKIPIISTVEMVDFLICRMEKILKKVL